MNFENIYHEYKNLVYNLALQYVQNAEDAEEITQDVFLTVYEKLNSFRQQSKLSTWLYRITINKSLDFLKAKKRKKRFGFLSSIFHEESGELKIDVSDFNHPGILLEQKEEMEELFRLINELPDNQKTVLILLKIEEKSQNEVAEIMNISSKAVESLFQRAKNNLTNKLNQTKENEK